MRRKATLAITLAAAMAATAVPAMADDVTTITYWVNDRHDSEYMTEMVEKYNKENTDNIYIDMQIITDDYENMISLAYTGGTAPDIIGQSVTLKNFVDNDMLVPLNDYIDADGKYQSGNFSQADAKCAEKWNASNKDGKSDWTAAEVRDWRRENQCSWHERCDTRTMDLVSRDIHSYFGHYGGCSECKVRDAVNVDGGGFDE